MVHAKIVNESDVVMDQVTAGQLEKATRVRRQDPVGRSGLDLRVVRCRFREDCQSGDSKIYSEKK